MDKDIIPIFIGYDPREAIAFHTCVNSIIRQSSKPVSIYPLALNLLEDYKETHTDGSNHFIYSRFLVPHLMNYRGWAIFMDGDMIVRGDIAELWDMRQSDKDVMVVKHDYKTKTSTKYLGSKNEDYPRKNWSSVILWNCQNHPNKTLTPEYVMKATGAQLHRFQHIKDERIGELPIEWNWLPDEFGENKDAKLLHYTLGTPSFHEFANTPQGAEWHRERILTEYCHQHNLPLDNL
jgi:lipopolysaccharide biosynthesis glycosyltransferase